MGRARVVKTTEIKGRIQVRVAHREKEREERRRGPQGEARDAFIQYTVHYNRTSAIGLGGCKRSSSSSSRGSQVGFTRMRGKQLSFEIWSGEDYTLPATLEPD